MQCGAKTRGGTPCRTPPMPNGRCRMHGGTSLAGGRASIVGTFLGVLTFALIFSLMTQMNLSTEVQQVTKGLIVLGAVLLQRPEARY